MERTPFLYGRREVPLTPRLGPTGVPGTEDPVRVNTTPHADTTPPTDKASSLAQCSNYAGDPMAPLASGESQRLTGTFNCPDQVPDAPCRFGTAFAHTDSPTNTPDGPDIVSDPLAPMLRGPALGDEDIAA